MASHPFTVLVVCRANHCRSPLAEHLLRVAASERDLDWQVSSAGTQARPGLAMHPFAARILAARGLDTAGWRSTGVTRDLVRQADLILTASEAHKTVVRFDPSAMSRTFTILQFAHLAGPIDPGLTVKPAEYGRWLMQQVEYRRGSRQPLSPGSRDLSDPMGKSFYQFRRCANSIQRALTQILRSGPPPPLWTWPSMADSGDQPRRVEDPYRLTTGPPGESDSIGS